MPDPCLKPRSRWAFPSAVLGFAVVLGWGFLPASRTRGASPAQNPDQETQAARWERLRTEFLQFGSPILESWTRAKDTPAHQAANQAKEGRRLEAEYQKAMRAHVEAEVQVHALKQDLETAKESIDSAESDLKRTRDALASMKVFHKKVSDLLVAEGTSGKSSGLMTRRHLDSDLERARLEFQRAEIELEQQKAKFELLTRFTLPDQEVKRKAEVETSRLEEQSRLEEWEKFRAEELKREREPKASEISPEDRRVLDLLVSVTRWSGPQPPWEQGEAELRAFLDQFETKLAEARRSASQVNKNRETERFLKLSTMIQELGQPAR